MLGVSEVRFAKGIAPNILTPRTPPNYPKERRPKLWVVFSMTTEQERESRELLTWFHDPGRVRLYVDLKPGADLL